MKKSGLHLLTIIEKLQYVFGAIFYKIYSVIPAKVFLKKNILDVVVRNSESVIRKHNILLIEKDSYQLELRIEGSDMLVYDQIFIKKEYENIVDLVNKHQINVGIIFDAGSNIGLTSLFLKRQFKNAQVICLEPDYSNFYQLKKNIENNKLTNTILLNEGLWYEADFLKVDNTFRDGKDWSKRLVKAVDAQVPVYSLSDYMLKYNLDRIDILKIDIEGAEEFIFNNDGLLDVLENVNLIAVEPHDLFIVGSEILQYLSKAKFQLYLTGELIVGVNHKFSNAK